MAIDEHGEGPQLVVFVELRECGSSPNLSRSETDFVAVREYHGLRADAVRRQESSFSVSPKDHASAWSKRFDDEPDGIDVTPAAPMNRHSLGPIDCGPQEAGGERRQEGQGYGLILDRE